jgi:Nif-specific regulatory protein
MSASFLVPAPASPDLAFEAGLLRLCDQRSPRLLLREALQLLVARTQAREVLLELNLDDELEGPIVVSEGCSLERAEDIRNIVSRGIMAEAMATGLTVECANAQIDPRFAQIESVEKQAIEAVLCVPLGAGSTYGAVYLQGRAGDSAEAWRFDAGMRAGVELVAKILTLVIDTLAQQLAIAGSERGSGHQHGARKNLREGDPLPDVFFRVVAKSQAMRATVEQLRMAAPLDIHLLLTGASGTGKTLLAQVTHLASARAKAAIVEINCAAIPDTLIESELFGSEPGAHSTAGKHGAVGKLEAAEGGTLFLDEVGDLSLAAQAKLLQFLQSKTYYRLGSSALRQADVRVIAATNVDLRRAVDERRFREDLYFRLKVLEVRVPSLSERRSDIAPLALSFLRSALRRHSLGEKVLTPSALTALQAADWAGNVRELGHKLESAALQAHLRGAAVVAVEDLFPEVADQAQLAALQSATRTFQRDHLQKVLATAGWNMPEAARLLDISRTHLYALVRSLAITRA